jgi:hypothetical protein
MALNIEAAQLVTAAAIVDRRFARQLLSARGKALQEVEHLPGAPQGVRLTDEDRLLLGSIRAASLQQFAQGVERLCGGVRALPPRQPAAAQAGNLALATVAAGEPSLRGGQAARGRPAALAALAPLAVLGLGDQ